MWRWEMKRLIEEQAEKIEELEKKLKSREKELEDYRKRESSVIDALANAHAQGERYVELAQKQAGQILLQAKTQARDIVRETRESQSDILRNARTEAEKGEHLSRQFNESLRRAAERARIAADQYAELIEQCSFDEKAVEREKEDNPVRVPLQDRPDDMAEPDTPAQLMQNIYRLQNRDLPDSEPKSEPENATPSQPIPREEVQTESRTGDGEELMPDLSDLLREIGNEIRDEEKADFDMPASAEEEENPVPPTVSEVLGGEATEEEISLDALLDDIIRSAD